MKQIFKKIAIVTILLSTGFNFAQEKANQHQQIETVFYNLYKPENTEAVLILFGGFPETAADIENGFPITALANDKNVAVAYLNFNRAIWLEEEQKAQLANSIQEIFTSNNLPTDEIYLGGMSSGGNVALLIGNFLSGNEEYTISPQGIFIVDSPVDLAALYRVAETNIERNFSEASTGESKFMLGAFNARLGNPNEEITEYEKHSVFIYETENSQNLKNLKNTRLRFYTEPDTLWWKQNRGVDYEEMNAFHVKRLSEFLTSNNYEKVEFISTENKGYRANGMRHPHSWSLVDQEELLQWILK